MDPWKVVAFALAVLGAVVLAVGASIFAQGIVQWDPSDPANYDSPAEAQDPAARERVSDQRDQVITEGFIGVTAAGLIFAGAIGVLAFRSE